MNPIRAVIVDDEPLARELIASLVAEDPGVELIAQCANGESAVSAILSTSPDLVFLDVQMPGMDGFEVLDTVGPDRSPVIIFVTAYDRHAVRAFEVHALDYLLKPVAPDRFRECLGRAKNLIRRDQRYPLEGFLRERGRFLKRLAIKDGDRILLLRTDDVDWLEAEGNYVRVHMGKTAHLVRDTISNLESRLDPEGFRRIHRSTIVNVERVRELQHWFHGDYKLILKTGHVLTLSRRYRDRLADVI
jgi:two-component system LytT family response regulator